MSQFPIVDFVTPRPFCPMAGTHVEYTIGTGFINVNVPKGAQFVLVQAIDQNIRFCLDGTNPTAASGFRIVADDPPFIIGLATQGNLHLEFNGEAAGAILVLEFGE